MMCCTNDDCGWLDTFWRLIAEPPAECPACGATVEQLADLAPPRFAFSVPANS